MTRTFAKRLIIVSIAALAAALTMSLTACSSVGSDVPPPSSQVAAETTEAVVYYSTGRSLLAEKKVIDANNTYGEVISILLKAEPTSEKNVAVVQPVAKVLSVTVKDHVATVDWDKAVLDFQATDDEKRLARAAFLLTLGQFPEVEKVRFTVEGATSGTAGGKDVQEFWGAVTLKDQPWNAARMNDPNNPAGSAEPTETSK